MNSGACFGMWESHFTTRADNNVPQHLVLLGQARLEEIRVVSTMRAALKQGCLHLRAYVAPKINGVSVFPAQLLVVTRLHGTATSAPIVELAPAAKIPTSGSGVSNKSKYVGVHWHRLTRKWLAKIHVDRTNKHI